jgi:FkbM family methyltransferase
MPGLYFFGIRKSIIKKTPPFKYLFDIRDRRNYQQLLKSFREKDIKDIPTGEAVVRYSINEKELKLIFRKFPCSDLTVLHQVFVLGCYAPIIKQMFLYFSANAGIKIIDAGANVGYSSVYFKTFFSSSELIAIEPEENNIHQLEKNLLVNNLQLTELVRGALWHRKAFLEVVRDFRDNRDAAFTVKETAHSTGIPGYSFEEILKKNNWNEVDLLKIDIEGGERFLFDTEEKADSILQKTKFLAIEIHDEFNIRKTICDHLKRNGFDYFEFDDLTLAINKTKVRGS